MILLPLLWLLPFSIFASAGSTSVQFCCRSHPHANFYRLHGLCMSLFRARPWARAGLGGRRRVTLKSCKECSTDPGKHTYIHIYTHINIHIYIYELIYTIHTDINVKVCACVYMCVYINIYIYITLYVYLNI